MFWDFCHKAQQLRQKTEMTATQIQMNSHENDKKSERYRFKEVKKLERKIWFLT